MTTSTTTRITGGAPLRDVGEGPPPSRILPGSVVAVVVFVVALVLLPLALVVPPSAVVAAVALWIVFRLGERARSL